MIGCVDPLGGMKDGTSSPECDRDVWRRNDWDDKLDSPQKKALCSVSNPSFFKIDAGSGTSTRWRSNMVLPGRWKCGPRLVRKSFPCAYAVIKGVKAG